MIVACGRSDGDWATMTSLVDDNLLETIAVRGIPSECAGQILDRFGDLATRLAFYQPYAANPETTGEPLSSLRGS